MASLTEVYEGRLRTGTTSRRVYAGASCFAVGAAMVVGSIVVSTTTAGASLGLDRIAARTLAGTLAGLGLPATLLGVFTVLPGDRTTRAASVIGASVTVLGVALFLVAYPDQWFGAGDPLALVTVAVYFVGAMTTLACLFVGLATFKTRNDPGGTARMEITDAGNVRLVEDAEPDQDFGSVGFLGTDPRGDVQTQTNREDLPHTDREDGAGGAEIIQSAATTDGGSAAVDDRTDTELIDGATERGRPDVYCGNCDHFEYVKVDGTITPYCGLHDELMEDMDPCGQWTEAN